MNKHAVRSLASVVIFIGCGARSTQPSTATGTKLRDWVKALDTTRPVTWGANHMKDDGGQRAVAAILDLQGYNYFVGDANTDTDNFQIDKDHKANSQWVIFGSEELSNVKSRGVYTTQNTDLHWTGCGQGSTRECTSYDVGWGDGFNNDFLRIARPQGLQRQGPGHRAIDRKCGIGPGDRQVFRFDRRNNHRGRAIAERFR